MNPKDLFHQAIAEATGCVKQVRSEQLAVATPCSEWDLRQLLNHTVYELLWVPDMLAGKTIQEVGDKYEGDVLGEDIQAAWRQATEKAIKAVDAADLEAVVHLSYGDRPARHYITEVSGDMLVHGWDIGQSIHCTLLMDKPLAEALYAFYEPQKDSLTAGGAFAAPLPVADNDDIQTKLLALLGRDIGWHKLQQKTT
jgi:uncharacterized protein (TIGR03086 family)